VSCKKVGEIIKYVFSARIRDEIIRIGRAGEEINKEDSYFPYMREMRLSKRSPYSSAEKIHLHNWISIFSALLGSERSFNARLVSEDGLLITMNLALFAAHAFRKYSTPQIAFGTELEVEMIRALKDYDDDNSQGGFEIDPASPIGVFKHMLEYSVLQHITTMFAQLISKMGTPRDKTIGMFLKRNLYKFNNTKTTVSKNKT